jgi:metacaspase-1
MATKVFLLAINNYPTAPLNGCVNDALIIASLLESKYGVRKTEIRMLGNSRGLKRKVVERLNWLVQSKPGDRILFWQSGHGVQMPTRSEVGEVDGLDEAFCMYDFDWEDDSCLRDKDYVGIFKKLPNGVRFTWGSDSCHSGDLRKNFPNPNDSKTWQQPRTMRMPFDIRHRYQAALAEGFKLKKLAVDGGVNCQFVPGCQSGQTSADAYIDGEYHGAMTYYFCKALEACGKTAPFSSVVDKCREYLADNGYEQIPQAEGPQAAAPFFGG